MKNAVDLYTALKLIGIFDLDEDPVFLRKETDMPVHRPSKILAVKTVKEQYDLRRMKVIGIRPCFSCDEMGSDYKGMILTITDKEE